MGQLKAEFQDIITKEKTEIAEAQTYNESITNLQNSKESLLGIIRLGFFSLLRRNAP